MKAARLHQNQTRLRLEQHADLKAAPGCAVVNVESVFMSPYMGSLIDGSGGFTTPPRPFTPGMDCVGTVESIADDVQNIRVGDRVYCDQYIEDNGGSAYVFAGCFPLAAGSEALMATWPDGALATQIMLPAECLTNVAPALAVTSADTLSRLGWLGTAHEALVRAGVQSHSRVVVLGATGLLGCGAVLVALAMGVARIVAVGRSKERLTYLADLDSRVETSLEVPSGIDVVISAADTNEAAWIEQAITRLDRRGSIVTVASTNPAVPISAMVAKDISISGSLWFPRSTPAELVDMIATGQLPVDRIQSFAYHLEDVSEALDKASGRLNPFEQVVVRP